MPPRDGPNRTTVGVIAILLGSLGIHKFMLGMTGPGVIQLVLTFCTGGFAGIIGFIEGIIYLTKTDEDFYQTYVVEKKQWF